MHGNIVRIGEPLFLVCEQRCQNRFFGNVPLRDGDLCSIYKSDCCVAEAEVLPNGTKLEKAKEKPLVKTKLTPRSFTFGKKNTKKLQIDLQRWQLLVIDCWVQISNFVTKDHLLFAISLHFDRYIHDTSVAEIKFLVVPQGDWDVFCCREAETSFNVEKKPGLSARHVVTSWPNCKFQRSQNLAAKAFHDGQISRSRTLDSYEEYQAILCCGRLPNWFVSLATRCLFALWRSLNHIKHLSVIDYSLCLQCLSVLMVIQNTVELLIGLKALPKGAKVSAYLLWQKKTKKQKNQLFGILQNCICSAFLLQHWMQFLMRMTCSCGMQCHDVPLIWWFHDVVFFRR